MSITDVASTGPHHWYIFYGSLNVIIQDVYRLRETNDQDEIFIQFLTHAQSYLPSLPPSTKEQLLVLIGRILKPFKLRKGNVANVTEALNVLLRTRFPTADHIRIFEFVLQYTNQMHESFLTTHERDQLFWQLTVLFATYFPDYSSRVNNWLQTFHHLIIDCYLEREPFWLRHNLYILKRIRNHYDTKQGDVADFVVEYVTKVLFRSATIEAVKETVYIEYVQFLKAEERLPFEGLYTAVSKHQLFPYQAILFNQSPGVLVTIRSQQRLSARRLQSMRHTVSGSYYQMEEFKTALKLGKPLTNGTFIVTLFDNQTTYNQYLSLWNLRSDNGGMAVVENGRYLNYVYNEGDSVRNLGHELSHSFFFAWAGPDIVKQIPEWMMEGSAETLGNQTCNGFSFIQEGLKTWTPSIPWIAHLDYSHGSAVYHWGSVLFRYLYEKHPQTLRHLLIAAKQKSSSKRTFNRVVSEIESHSFSDFLIKDQQACDKDHVKKLSSSTSSFTPDLSPTPPFTIYDTPPSENTETFFPNETEQESREYSESPFITTPLLNSAAFEMRIRASPVNKSTEVDISIQEAGDLYKTSSWELAPSRINETFFPAGNATPPYITNAPPYNNVESSFGAGWLLVIFPVVLLFLCVFLWFYRRPTITTRRLNNSRASKCLLKSYVVKTNA